MKVITEPCRQFKRLIVGGQYHHVPLSYTSTSRLSGRHENPGEESSDWCPLTTIFNAL